MADRRFAVPALRVLIGLVFAYAGWVKIRAAAEFAESIAGFRLLPFALNNLLAIGLPPFEILLGVLLVGGWRRRTAAFCALLTSGGFLIALGSAAVRGIAVDCGCFGAAAAGALPPGQQIWLSIGRDVLLVVAAGLVYAEEWKRGGRPRLPRFGVRVPISPRPSSPPIVAPSNGTPPSRQL